MNRAVVTPLAVLFTMLVGAGELWAFRCGNDLILEGDRKIEVLRSCGEPDLVDSWEEKRRGHVDYYGYHYPIWQYVLVEEWTYNLGPNQFIRILRFANGRLEKIETGDYGF